MTPAFKIPEEIKKDHDYTFVSNVYLTTNKLFYSRYICSKCKIILRIYSDECKIIFGKFHHQFSDGLDFSQKNGLYLSEELQTLTCSEIIIKDIIE